MTETDSIVLEILRKMQADIAHIKAVQTDHSHQFIRLREEMNQLRGDDLRRESV